MADCDAEAGMAGVTDDGVVAVGVVPPVDGVVGVAVETGAIGRVVPLPDLPSGVVVTGDGDEVLRAARLRAPRLAPRVNPWAASRPPRMEAALLPSARLPKLAPLAAAAAPMRNPAPPVPALTAADTAARAPCTGALKAEPVAPSRFVPALA